MRKTGKLAIIALLGMLYCGCHSVTFSPQVDEILAKARKARDPHGNLEKMKTQVVKGKFRSNTKNKPMEMELTFKKPGMLKIKVIISDEAAFVKAYDGKTGWLFSTKKGLQKIKGKQLDELKLQASLLSPGASPADVFETIELKGETVEVGQKCYKFVCQPKAEFKSQPITFYVSKESSFIIKRVEKHDAANGREIDIVTIFNDFQPADGIMAARHIVSYRDGNLMEFNVESIKWNEKVNSSTFAPPKALK